MKRCSDDDDIVELMPLKKHISIVDNIIDDLTFSTVIAEDSYSTELAEKRAILRAITTLYSSSSTSHASLPGKDVFVWCKFCKQASSVVGQEGKDNYCWVCTEEIPCSLWCSEKNWAHITSCKALEKRLSKRK